MIVLGAALWLPETGNLWVSDEHAWMVYLSLQQVVMGLLFALLASVRAFRWVGLAGFLWCFTQAADELTNGNLWAEQHWEFPLSVALLLSAWLMMQLEKR